MQLVKLKKPSFTINSRKYRFLLSELVLFTAFWIVYNWVMLLFPVMDTNTADILSSGNYVVYMFYMLISLFFLGLAIFLLGVWWQQWRSEKLRGDNVCAIP